MITSTSYVKPYKEQAVSRVETENFSFGITKMSSPDNAGSCVVWIDVHLTEGIDLVAEALRIQKETLPETEGHSAYLAVARVMVSQMTKSQKASFEAQLAELPKPQHA